MQLILVSRGRIMGLERFLYIECNVFAMIILALMYRGKRREFLTKDQILFNHVIISTMTVLGLDTVTWVINGVMFPHAQFVGYLVNWLFWLSSMIPCYLGFLFGYYKVYHRLGRRVCLIAAIPVFTAIVLLIANFGTGWIFTVSEANVYHRGPIFFVAGLLPFAHIIAAEVVVAGRFRRVPQYERSFYELMAAILLFPIVGCIIQTAFYGTSTIWLCMTVDVMVFYIYLQNGNISLDFLTKLNNRRRFDNYARLRCEEMKADDNLYLIMIDINNFKNINDTYGHAEGDSALAMTAMALRKAAASRRAFLARIGGDEFAMIMENTDVQKTEAMVRKIRRCMDYENAGSGKAYTVSLAIGYAGMRGSDQMKFDRLFTLADARMYTDKRQFH